jgi:hypothetical protein
MKVGRPDAATGRVMRRHPMSCDANPNQRSKSRHSTRDAYPRTKILDWNDSIFFTGAVKQILCDAHDP